MLRDNGIISDVVQIVRADSFYSDSHQKIFKGIADLYDKGQPVDLVMLAEHLKQQKQLEDVGDAAYLGELWLAAPTAANAEYYARIVRDRAIIRNLIHASTEILRDAYDQGASADEMLGEAERKILKVAELGVTGQTYTLEEAIAAAYDRIDARQAEEQRSISGLSTGFVDLDEITAGLQKSELIILAARPSVGKCLSFDSEIVTEDGSIATIEELYRRQQARVLTLGNDWQFTWTAPSAFVDDGIKPVYRVRTRLGRQIETTLSHPFLTGNGWQPLANLKVGERIAVPRAIQVEGTASCRDCEVKILAYLLGDGCLADSTPEFTNSNSRLRDDFIGAVKAFGPLKVRSEDGGGTRTTSLGVAADDDWVAQERVQFGVRLREAIRGQRTTARTCAAGLGVTPSLISQWGSGVCLPSPTVFEGLCTLLSVEPVSLAPEGLETLRGNVLTSWLRGLGLWGKKSAEKFIPPFVFRLSSRQMALFLNRLFATDGWATILSEGQTQLGYATTSERLARQVQHLLLRFGIIATLRQRSVLYREQRRPAWQLDITDPRALRTFIARIGIFGKEEAVQRVNDLLNERQPRTNCDLLPDQVWDQLEKAKASASWAALAERAGLGRDANIHVRRHALTRPRLQRFADALGDVPLQQLAQSEVCWDRIVSIEFAGHKQVYDLTIPDTHNFVANDICVHNTAFSLNLVRNIITQERAAVFFVSLEQARVELAERLLCSQAKVDSHRLRKGNLTGDDLSKLIEAGGVLRNAPLFIDDSPGQGMLRIAANARRLKLRHGLKLVVIDYLQLIEPENRRDPRQEQVAQISRKLKFLARELDVPVIALAQVNRSSEDRQDHRPRLADLRESGCLTGETLVTMANTGERIPIRELVERSGFEVWALNETTKALERARVTHAFCTGRKPVFQLETTCGRMIRATANHKFLGQNGWTRLDQFQPGNALLVPRMRLERLGERRSVSSPVYEEPASLRCAARLTDNVAVEWAVIRSIVPDGIEEVFDLTVPGPANFLANDFLPHNSIEQDADTVMMLHRPDRYEPGQQESIIEVIIAKQRNGPTGEVTLAYLKEFMRYEDKPFNTGFDG